MKKLILFISVVSLLFIACSKKEEAPKEKTYEQMLAETVVDLTKIPVTPKVKSPEEEIISSYEGNFMQLSLEIDSLVEQYPDSYIMRSVQFSILARFGNEALVDFADEMYNKEPSKPLNQFFYALAHSDSLGKPIFTKMIKENPDNFLGYFGMAQTELQKNTNDLEDAAKLAYLAILKDPHNEDAFNLLSIIYDRLGKTEQKAQLNGILLRINPESFEAFNNVLQYYVRKNDAEKAIALLKAFEKNNPDRLSNLDFAYFMLNFENYDDAEKYLEKAREANESAVFVTFLYAKLYAATGREAEAMSELKDFKNISSDKDKQFFSDPVLTENLYKNKEYREMLKEVEGDAPTIGDKAYELDGRYLSDGSDYDPKSLEGKVYLIDFWAAWCKPCRDEMPNVIAVYDELKSKGFEVIGVNLDEQKKNAEDFVMQNKMTWRHIYSGEGWKDINVANYQVKGIPATYLVDKNGIIRYKGIRGKKLLMEKVSKLLAE